MKAINALVFGLIFILNGESGSAMIMSTPPAASGDVAVHGMFAFGDKTLYLSHLPMFHAPHDEQAIFEALFETRGMAAYAEAKKNDPDQEVTIVPQPFSLLEMIAHPTMFKASLYKGHFERGGLLLASNISVQIVKIVHAHHLGDSTYASTADISFGEAGESYRAHFITTAPDVDKIERLEAKTGRPTGIYYEEDDLRE